MALLTRENAPLIQSLLTEVSLDKPGVGRVVRVLTGKYSKQVGTVEKHIVSRFERPFRYGNEMSHCMTQARARYGYAILVRPENGAAFWTKADNVMVCCDSQS